MALACLYMRMSIAEAITASTLNGAASLGLAESIGSLEVGKRCDAVILDAPSHYHLVYHWGVNQVKTTIKDGVVIWNK
jgi:imidazolonepropionase